MTLEQAQDYRRQAEDIMEAIAAGCDTPTDEDMAKLHDEMIEHRHRGGCTITASVLGEAIGLMYACYRLARAVA